MKKNEQYRIVNIASMLFLMLLITYGCGKKNVVKTAKEDVGGAKMVVISTKFGDMTVKLYDETPLHRDNFLKLVKDGTYDSTIFHRVIKAFMIQGGDPNSKGAAKEQRLGTGGPGYTVPAEINAKFIHKKGALCAARQGDRANPEKRSSGSQFYIVQGKTYTEAGIQSLQTKMKQRNPSAMQYTEQQIKDYIELGGTPHLDGEYTVFGEVIEGMAIIDSIANVSTARGDRPHEDIIMQMKIAK